MFLFRSSNPEDQTVRLNIHELGVSLVFDDFVHSELFQTDCSQYFLLINDSTLLERVHRRRRSTRPRFPFCTTILKPVSN